MSGSEEELQQTAQQLQEIESRLEALQSQAEMLQVRKTDIGDAIEALQTLETGSTVQVPVGGGAYVRASVEDMEEVIVGLGGGYAAERTDAGAVEILEDRQDRIDDRLEDLQETISELQAEGEQLGQRAQQQLQQLQAMQEQAQGQGLGGPGQGG